MKPIGLHASDTHLCPRIDEQFAFQQIVDAAIEHRVDYLMLAGDLLDKQTNRAKTVSFLYLQLERLRKCNISVLYTQGQHDFDDPPWFSGVKWTTHLHKQSFSVGGSQYRLYGLDWQPFGKLQEELVEIPSDVDFLICHQVWGDWMGDIAAPQGTFNQIPGHIKFVQSGDLHQWKLERKKNLNEEKMWTLSTGATTQRKIDEPDTHYYALFYPDGHFEKKVLRSRVYLESSLMLRTEDVDQFMGELEPILAVAHQKAAARELPEEMYRPVFRISYSAKLTDVVRRVEKAIDGRAILNFKERPPEEKIQEYANAKKTKKGDAVTPKSVLGEEVDKEESPAVYELCERMLSAEDKELEFAKWRAEFLGETT